MECVICGADTCHCGGCDAKTAAEQEALRNPLTSAERQRLTEEAAERATEVEAQRALLAEFHAALTEAQPIGNTDKLTALIGRLIAELAAARKEIADIEASWR